MLLRHNPPVVVVEGGAFFPGSGNIASLLVVCIMHKATSVL